MTDAEINLAIAKIEYPYEDIVCKGIRIHSNTTGETWLVNYVNNWSDIGPIIERECIDIHFTEKGWYAQEPDWSHYCRGYMVRAETPTKAAALCYLKMKESE